MMRTLLLLVALSLSCRLLFGQDNVADVRATVQRFTDSLTPTQKEKALLGFNDTSRAKWNNLPIGLRPRVGLNIGSMSDQQRRLVHRILSASLSSQGYLKATSIMHLDNLLGIFFDSLYQRKEITDTLYQMIKTLKFGHQNYYLALFGDPRSDSVWGYKVEGHHLSLNFTFLNDQLAITPMFVGTDPAEYPSGEYAGWRVLGLEEDLGMKLLFSLTPDQQQKATWSKEVPVDIITGAESGKRLVENWGIPGSGLSEKQRTIMQKVIREFVFNLEYDRAVKEYDKIVKAGFEKVYFGWIGAYEESKPHYYILNGPTFLIEFDNNGGPRRSANHIHAIWREKGNEFGEDLLKLHYDAEPHHHK
jgi:hypothetical protein